MDNSAVHVGVLGATSSVGKCLLPLLVAEGFQVTAFTRQKLTQGESAVHWTQFPTSTSVPGFEPSAKITHWICVAPIWVLKEHFPMLKAFGARRLVTLSSTSRFTKEGSSSQAEQSIAQRLVEGESYLQAWACSHGVEWTILRPTLIYGMGSDKNIGEIAKVIRKLKFFPILGKALGLRQPIHTADVAQGCLASLIAPAAANRAYNVSGGETLTYREMVKRVFAKLERPVVLLPIPLPMFRLAIWCLRFIPRYRNWTPAMAERMNSDLVFEHSEASRDFGFSPRPFVLGKEDIPG